MGEWVIDSFRFGDRYRISELWELFYVHSAECQSVTTVGPNHYKIILNVIFAQSFCSYSCLPSHRSLTIYGAFFAANFFLYFRCQRLPFLLSVLMISDDKTERLCKVREADWGAGEGVQLLTAQKYPPVKCTLYCRHKCDFRTMWTWNDILWMHHNSNSFKVLPARRFEWKFDHSRRILQQTQFYTALSASNVQRVMCIVQCASNVQCAMCIVQCNVYCTMCKRCAMYNVHCAMQCLLFNVKCTTNWNVRLSSRSFLLIAVHTRRSRVVGRFSCLQIVALLWKSAS